MTVVILFLHSTRHAPNSYPQLLVVWKRLPQVLFACVAWKKGVYYVFPCWRSTSLTPNTCLIIVMAPVKVQLMRLYVQPISRSEEHTSELQSHSDLVCR